ncbi:hypothetical protein ACFT8P_05685 [Streptomyces sp. NPDC057101]
MHAGEVETSILLHATPELVGDGQADADHDGGDRRSSSCTEWARALRAA